MDTSLQYEQRNEPCSYALPFVQVPQICLSWTHGEYKLYSVLTSHLNPRRTGNRCWPSLTTLAQQAGLASADQARRYIRKLQARGAIRIDPRQDTSNRYFVRFLVVEGRVVDAGAPIIALDWELISSGLSSKDKYMPVQADPEPQQASSASVPESEPENSGYTIQSARDSRSAPPPLADLPSEAIVSPGMIATPGTSAWPPLAEVLEKAGNTARAPLHFCHLNQNHESDHMNQIQEPQQPPHHGRQEGAAVPAGGMYRDSLTRYVTTKLGSYFTPGIIRNLVQQYDSQLIYSVLEDARERERSGRIQRSIGGWILATLEGRRTDPPPQPKYIPNVPTGTFLAPALPGSTGETAGLPTGAG